MKVLFMHSGNSGFFPRYYLNLKSKIENNGDECYLLTSNSGLNKKNVLPNQYIFGTRFNWFIHFHLYKFFGLQDIYSFFDTIHLIILLKRINPDVIHLNVVNAWMINFPLFIWYVNKKNIPIVWTFHDCRTLTGRCAHFEDIGCDKWKSGCGKCPMKKDYWPTYLDNSHLQWKIRNFLFNKFKDLTIVTPSKWLANYVEQSYFNKYPLKVIYNGVDTKKFNSSKSTFLQEKYDLYDKFILLNVSVFANRLKGLDYLIKLATDLPEKFKIVIVGNVSDADKARVPSNVLLIPPVKDSELLANIYQSANIYVNPTLVDNFPTVNIEALASGLPIVTFDTGGSAEAIDETCGLSVPKGDYNQLKEAVLYMALHLSDYSKENCSQRSKLFSLDQCLEYVNLYHSIKNER